MNYFISLWYFFFWVVDGPLQTDAMLMRLNINGSEPSNHGGPSESEARCSLSLSPASSPTLPLNSAGKHLRDCT